jgi:hypothetical protein
MTTTTKPRPRKKGMTPLLALEKRKRNIERYLAFLLDYIDSDLGTHLDMHCVQHGGPDQFYSVVRLAHTSIDHDHLTKLMGLVIKHGGKMHFRDGTPEVYLGRDA